MKTLLLVLLTAALCAIVLANHAAWVGTLSYGTTAELAASGKIHAPVIELRERDRYPPGDPSWSADLTKPGIKVALCAVQVPCGAAAKTALAATRSNLLLQKTLLDYTLGNLDHRPPLLK